jgi:putative hydrolase of the HAD superfamily
VTVEAVLFDMWRAAARVLAPQDPEPVAAALLAAEHDWWRRRVGEGDGTGSGTTEEIVRSVAEVTHLDVSAALEAYHGAWEVTVDHDPHAADCLAALRASGVRTGLLSNTHWPRALHERWLDDAGLLDLLDARVYTSELAHMKPHREAFLALTTALDVRPGACVFVGDRPRDDVSGARALGMRTVLMTGRPVEGFPVEPDAELVDLSGLSALVAAWR